MLNRPTVLAIVKATLAVDFACGEAAFDYDGVSIVAARELPGRRRFPFRTNFAWRCLLDLLLPQVITHDWVSHLNNSVA